MIAYRCPKCHYVTAEGALQRQEDGSLRCPNCDYALDYEKRCSTCANWWRSGCLYFKLRQEDNDTVCKQPYNAIVKALFDLEKGPPWPDCRGWEPKEKKS